MGGEDAGEWDTYPEEKAILIGTQDMLLSRALNCPRTHRNTSSAVTIPLVHRPGRHSMNPVVPQLLTGPHKLLEGR
jgi:hypothetical protein